MAPPLRGRHRSGSPATPRWPRRRSAAGRPERWAAARSAVRDHDELAGDLIGLVSRAATTTSPGHRVGHAEDDLTDAAAVDRMVDAASANAAPIVPTGRGAPGGRDWPARS